MNTLQEYLQKFPPHVQTLLQNLRKEITKAAPDATEAFVYGAPAFKINNKTVIIYAAFKNHVGIYPEANAIRHFKKELAHYKTAQGTIRFPFDKPLPFTLIRKIVKFRVKELSENKK